MKDNIIFTKNKNMASRVIDDETILLPIVKSSKEASYIFTLNKSGSYIWGLIDGRRDIGEIKSIILERFAVTPYRLEREMKEFLKDLIKLKAITYTCN